MGQSRQYKTEQPAATRELGKKIGQRVKSGQLLLLVGELGSGKTLLVKGLARGLGITAEITSPTYILINEYQSGRLPLYHMDLYRLNSATELLDIGFEDYLFKPGVVALEWPEIAET